MNVVNVASSAVAISSASCSTSAPNNVLPAMASDGREPEALRDLARAAILARVGEPDVAELAHAAGRAR